MPKPNEGSPKSTPGSEPYLLNSQRITQLLLNPVFFHDCAAYFFLFDLAATCQKASIANRDPRAMRPAIAGFVRHTLKLQLADDKLLDPLREFLYKKLGYMPPAFMLYYGSEGERHELVF